jgi:hypothetical protein
LPKPSWRFSTARIAETGNVLLPGATKIHHPESRPIRKASAFSVEMRGAFISKSYDTQRWNPQKKPKDTNDLLIVSSFQTGTRPTVQMVHFLKEKQKINEFVGDFYKTLVCSFSDFKDNHLTLQTQVFDIDDAGDIRDTISNISSLSANILAPFPVLMPYLAIGGTIASSITKVMDRLNKHDRIIDSNLRLIITEEQDVGYQILQTGHWICFNGLEDEEEKEKTLILDRNMRIFDKDTRKPFDECNYAIYSIREGETKEPNWEIDQKIATLLSQLDKKGNTERAAIEFLRETMEGYNKFQKIRRLQELEKKKDRTAEEEALLNNLKNDESLRDFY